MAQIITFTSATVSRILQNRIQGRLY